MYIRMVRSSVANLRPSSTPGIHSRGVLSLRQSLRGSAEWTPVRRPSPSKLTARVCRSSSRFRSGLPCFAAGVSASAVEDPQESGMDVGVTKRSELSNGPLPDTLQLGEVLGKGTFGEVYRGVDTTSGAEFAVKVISKKRSGKDSASIDFVMERVEHEVRLDRS